MLPGARDGDIRGYRFRPPILDISDAPLDLGSPGVLDIAIIKDAGDQFVGELNSLRCAKVERLRLQGFKLG